MSKVFPKIIVFIFIFLSFSLGSGWVIASDPTPEQRQFDENKLEEYRTEQDFQYDIVNYRQSNIWGKIQYYLYQALRFLFGKKGTAAVIRYLFLAVVILFVVLQLTGARMQWFFGKGINTRTGIVHIPDEDITNIDLQELADKALRDGNLRLCIRYQYLHLLKVLDEKAYIVWHKDKTNRDYLAEIQESEIRKQFRQQTLAFDYVWYGNFKISEDQFNLVNAGFQDLVNELQSQK